MTRGKSRLIDHLEKTLHVKRDRDGSLFLKKQKDGQWETVAIEERIRGTNPNIIILDEVTQTNTPEDS